MYVDLPLPCEGREAGSDRPSAQVLLYYRILNLEIEDSILKL